MEGMKIEGMRMEYAIEIIQQKAMKAEEQRCLRRRQVCKRIGFSLALVLLIGINLRGGFLMRVFAREPVFPIWEFAREISAEGSRKVQKGETIKESGTIKESEMTQESEPVLQMPKPHYTSIRVERGDSLWSIASRYAADSPLDVRGYVEELKRINQLTDDTIHAGHYLMVVYYK